MTENKNSEPKTTDEEPIIHEKHANSPFASPLVTFIVIFAVGGIIISIVMGNWSKNYYPHPNMTNVRGYEDTVKDIENITMNMAKLKSLRQVSIELEGGDVINHVVLEGHLDRMLEATKKLYVEGGINPHSGRHDVKVNRIWVSELESNGPFWWSAPSGEQFDVENGAVIFDWRFSHDVYPAPEHVQVW